MHWAVWQLLMFLNLTAADESVGLQGFHAVSNSHGVSLFMTVPVRDDRSAIIISMPLPHGFTFKGRSPVYIRP